MNKIILNKCIAVVNLVINILWKLLTYNTIIHIPLHWIVSPWFKQLNTNNYLSISGIHAQLIRHNLCVRIFTTRFNLWVLSSLFTLALIFQTEVIKLQISRIINVKHIFAFCIFKRLRHSIDALFCSNIIDKVLWNFIICILGLIGLTTL